MKKFIRNTRSWIKSACALLTVLTIIVPAQFAAAANTGLSINAEAQANKPGMLGASGLTQQQLESMQSQNMTKSLLTPPPTNFKPECPANLKCVFKPAAYAANSDALNDFGNYNLASRTNDLSINQIVIHSTEGSLQSAIDHFQDSTSYVSSNYVIGKDGTVVQMVRLQDVAFQAGDWYVNMHSIGIEHEGYAEKTPLTAAQYTASTTLTKWLAAKYSIPLDRSHIVGHDNAPTPSDDYMGLQHWDPGPYFDWNHYMTLVGGSNGPVASNDPNSQYVTITPNFARNLQVTSDCSKDPCVKIAARASNFLPLYKGPSTRSGLIKDPYLGGLAGTDAQSDWGDKAPTGYSYIVAKRQVGWTAIWFGGQMAWLQDNGGVTTASAGITLTPKANSAVAVYGRPLPEPTAAGWKDIPADLKVQQVALTKYKIQPGQMYTVNEAVTNDYAEGCMNIACSYPGDTTVVIGNEKYLSITYNHRYMYVKLSDVTLNYKG